MIKQNNVALILKTRLLCFWLALGVVQAAFAHQQKEAYTTLRVNQNTGLLEVAHRFYIHDAEHVVARLESLRHQGKLVDFVADELVQSEFASYVERKFSLADDSFNVIPINSIGFEIEGKYFWVYQEAEIPTSTKLNIRHSALLEFWPRQINHINVEAGAEVFSVRLGVNDLIHWRSLPFVINTDSQSE